MTRYRVVYVDDEADSERFRSKVDILNEEGIDVVCVGDIREALRTLEMEVNVQALVLDILMPPFDIYDLKETDEGTTTGLRLLEDIRERYPDLPVVVVSVKPEERIRERVEQLGVAEYLKKPAMATAIVAAIRRAVGQQQSSD